MFELSVACKYLLPRRRQLSVSIISLISTLVISLVVWLIVVFFSVTDGLEKSWVQKLTALTAPVRITPTEAYYNSYYYQIDTISETSNYAYKTIHEKKEAANTDPYDPEMDEEIPAYWPAPDRQENGQLKDLVKLAYASIEKLKGIPGLKAQDFELTISNIRIELLREAEISFLPPFQKGSTRSFLSYPAYLGNLDKDNLNLNRALLPIGMSDVNNVFNLVEIAEMPETGERILFSPEILRKRLALFFSTVEITQLKTAPSGWTIPPYLLSHQLEWAACAIVKGNQIIRLVVPQQANKLHQLEQELTEQGLQIQTGTVSLRDHQLFFTAKDEAPLALQVPLVLQGGVSFTAHLMEKSVDTAKSIKEIKFAVEIPIQNTLVAGVIPYKGLQVHQASFLQSATSPAWIHQSKESKEFILPRDQEIGDGVLLPKSFKDAGVFTYLAPTASIIQEQRVSVYVAGFYDPGIIPIGGKFILANRDITTLIRDAHNADDKSATNGINVRFDRLEQADEVKTALLKAFKQNGIDRYWHIETYKEYEFTKEIMQELHNQKQIFTLIAIVIIIVACSNIISMLIILVNDKKMEIGILRSMGASSKSIAFIFGLAGGVIGIIGSALGIGAAILTLNHLQTLIGWISLFQGYDMFNTAFYGETLPHELSYEALTFVLIATVIISLLAGIVPAIKACLLKPSSILRSTGG
jgi:lipoprotein-releasing system permease protein